MSKINSCGGAGGPGLAIANKIRMRQAYQDSVMQAQRILAETMLQAQHGVVIRTRTQHRCANKKGCRSLQARHIGQVRHQSFDRATCSQEQDIVATVKQDSRLAQA